MTLRTCIVLLLSMVATAGCELDAPMGDVDALTCGDGTDRLGDRCVPADRMGPDCARGAVARDGLCVPGQPETLDCGVGTVAIDGVCEPDGDRVALDCGHGTRHRDGECVVDEITDLRIVEAEVSGGPIQVGYPLDLDLALAGVSEEPLDVRVKVDLVADDGSLQCTAGVVTVVGVGNPEVQGLAHKSARLYLPDACASDGPLNVRLRVDPFDALAQPDRDEPVVTLVGDALEVSSTSGLDLDIVQVKLESSVVRHRRCHDADPDSKHRCWRPTGGSAANELNDLQVTLRVEAYGLPAFVGPDEEFNALGDHPMSIAYAVRPSDGGAWLPLYIADDVPGQPHLDSEHVSHLITRTPRVFAHALHFERRCQGAAGCITDTRALDLIDSGEWRDKVAFDLKVCVAGEAETSGNKSNNCTVTQFHLLRYAEAEGDSQGNIFGDAATDFGHTDGAGASAGRHCPTGSNLCASQKWGWGIPDPDRESGNPDFLALDLGFDSFSRVDLAGVTSKHDARFCVTGWINFCIVRAFAYVAGYPDPELLEADPDAPALDCSCNIKKVEPFADPEDACQTQCDLDEDGNDLDLQLGDEGAPTEEECAEKGLDANRTTEWNECKQQVCAECKANCQVDNEGTANPENKSGGGQAPAETQTTYAECVAPCDTNYTNCSNACPKSGSAKTKCVKQCKAGRKNCKKGCQKGKLLGCAKSDLEDLDGCACQGYYSFLVELFNGHIPGVPTEYLLWEASAAGAFSFGYDITKSKEWSKEKTWLIGPIPVTLGAGVTGELGLRLEIAMIALRGTEQPPTDPESCAVSTTEDRCGQPTLEGSTFCDAACELYGDCAKDYDEVCVERFPTLPVIDTNKVCLTQECKNAVARTNYAITVTGKVTPHTQLTAEAWVGIDAKIARALIKGSVTLIDAAMPIQLKAIVGVVGTPYWVRELIATGDLKGDLNMNFLAGTVSFVLEYIDIEWCETAFIKLPCGFTYSEWWNYKLAEWSGFPINIELFTENLGSFSTCLLPGCD